MFLGIDVGTSSVKAVIMAESGAVLAQARAPLCVSRPAPLWSEQEADDWWEATHAAVLALDPVLRAGVRGIGLSGQMHGATVLGTDDRPLRPAILWNDGRSFDECYALERNEPRTRAITGNIAMPGFTAPKLSWIRQHEPEIFHQIRSVLLPKDYVRLCLTGDKASDMADSAGTLWLNCAARCWSDVMLGACGLIESQMPSLYEGTEVTGYLRPLIAEQWGMATVPVAAGGGDNAAGAAGIGVVSNGDAMLSLGTSGVIFVATEDFRPNPSRAVHAFCHALPGMWHQMSVHLSAASCIDWAASLAGIAGPVPFLNLAEQAGPAAGPELFLPYLSGERTPHNDPHVRGAWLGLSNETDTGRLAAAVLEGVAFALADGLDALRTVGTQISALSVIGGGACSSYWGKIIAASLGLPLVYLDGGEVGPALGAARLARIAVTGASIAEVCTRPSVRQIIEPDAAIAQALSTKRDRFRAAYPLIAQIKE